MNGEIYNALDSAISPDELDKAIKLLKLGRNSKVLFDVSLLPLKPKSLQVDKNHTTFTYGVQV